MHCEAHKGAGDLIPADDFCDNNKNAELVPRAITDAHKHSAIYIVKTMDQT